MPRRTKGFTLLELMIVVAIIGILASIAIPKLGALIRTSNEGATKGRVGALRSQMSIYYADNEGNYPSDLTPFNTPGGKYEINALKVYTYDHGYKTTIDYAAAVDGTDSGGLGYVNSGSSWGQVWVECTHTDTKGRIWNEY
ncbi:MAG: type II secretion system protein [Elusimicrobiota bacterium]